MFSFLYMMDRECLVAALFHIYLQFSKCIEYIHAMGQISVFISVVTALFAMVGFRWKLLGVKWQKIAVKKIAVNLAKRI